MNRPETSISASWLKKLFYAVTLTLIVEWINIYLKYGEFFVPPDWGLALELGFSIIYFLSLFWIYPLISAFIHSKRISKLKSDLLNLLEGICVVFATISLTVLTKLLPLWIILWGLRVFYQMNAQFDLDAVRRSMIVHAILGLFFYYFVEREIIRKQIRKEHLWHAELQKEEFKLQLKHLEDQINPSFLYHSLQTLEDLIKTDAEKASNFVSNLSYLYRSFLNQKNQVVDLRKEIKAIKSFYELLQVHPDRSFSLTFNIQDTYFHFQIPPGILYLILEELNSFKISHSGLELSVKILSEETYLMVIAVHSRPTIEPFSENTLKKIKEKYQLLPSEPIKFKQAEGCVEIKLPLLKPEIEETF